MKTIKLQLLMLLIPISINLCAQDIYIGKIFDQGAPQFLPDFPPVPCTIFWLETTSGNYILSIDSHWICNNKLIVDGIEYDVGDEVEITGTVRSSGVDIYSVEHFSLEIETIKKLTSNIESVFFSNNKVYYDATKQIIVINETLQNQSLTFELVNMQGQAVLRKTNIDNSTFISVANLPSEVYLYRLLQNNQIIYSGKIIK